MCQYLYQHLHRQCFSPFAANMQYVVSFESVFLPCSIAHFHIDHCKTHKVLFNGFYHFFLFLFCHMHTKKANLSQHEETKHEKKNQHIRFPAPFFRSKWKKGIACKVVQKIDRILSIVQVGICRARIFSKMLLLFRLTMYKMFPCVDYEWYFLLSVRL